MASVTINSFGVGTGGEVPEWVQLATVGYWLGHPTRPYQVTEQDIAEMETSFRDDLVANSKQLVIDWNHESLRPGPGAGAAGWVDRVERRGRGRELWGHVSQWRPEAAQAVREKRFRYISPVYLFNHPDRVTGRPRRAQLHSAALTNAPFLRELPALVNSLQAGIQPPIKEDVEMEKPESRPLITAILAMLASMVGGMSPAVANALGVEQQAPAKEWLDALTAQLADPGAPMPPAVANALGVTADTEASQFLDLVVGRLAAPPATIERLPAPVANSLGVDPGAGADAVQARILQMQAAADLRPIANQLGIEQADTASIIAQIGRMQTDRAREQAEKLVANGMQAGRIPPANKDFWLEFAAQHPAQAESVIAQLPQVVSPGQAAANSTMPACAPALSEEEQEVCRQLDLAPDEFAAARQ